MTINYILNRGDWTTFCQHEVDIHWDKHGPWLRTLYLAVAALLLTTLFGGMGCGFFGLVRWLVLRTNPSTPEAATGLAWFGAAVFWFAWGVSTLIVIPWRFEEWMRRIRKRQVEKTLQNGEKTGRIQVGKRYLVTVAPGELRVMTVRERSAAGFSCMQDEDYHIAWDTVYAAEIVSNLLIVRSNYYVLLLPSHAFESHVEFYRQVAEIQGYMGEEYSSDDGRERTDIERPTTFKRKGPVEL